MKAYYKSGLKLSLVMLMLLCVIFPAILLLCSFTAPNKAEGRIIANCSKKIYLDIAHKYEGSSNFHCRPSAVDYNAGGSGGSNKGPNDLTYIANVKIAVDKYRTENHLIKGKVPVDAVTTSGSGLDPAISVENAKLQAKRIAISRNIDLSKIIILIEKKVEFNYFKNRFVNVNVLNYELGLMK